MKRLALVFMLVLLGCFLMSPLSLLAQYDNDVPKPFSLQNIPKQRPKFTVGGDFGLQLGSYTAINVSPQVGFYPASWLLIGGGVSYMYASQRYYSSSHLVGVNGFIQPRIAKSFLFHAEYEFTRVYTSFFAGDKNVFNNHNVALGLGYRHYVTDKVSVYGLALIDVYQSYWVNDYFPFLRIGVNVDL